MSFQLYAYSVWYWYDLVLFDLEPYTICNIPQASTMAQLLEVEHAQGVATYTPEKELMFIVENYRTLNDLISVLLSVYSYKTNPREGITPVESESHA